MFIFFLDCNAKNGGDKGHVYTQFQFGKSPTVIHQQLATVWGDKAVQYRSTGRWCEKIRNNDLVSFADKERIGRPVSTTTPKNVDQIRQLIEDYEYLTV